MGEQGFSLVESVVAIAILGFIVAAMVGGMATTIATSDIHRQQAEVNTVLVSVAETIRQLPYTPCAKAYSPLNDSWPIAVSVQYWDVRTSNWDGATCHDQDGSSLFSMQLVTVTVHHPHNRASGSIDVVKRAPCPDQAPGRTTSCKSGGA